MRDLEILIETLTRRANASRKLAAIAPSAAMRDRYTFAADAFDLAIADARSILANGTPARRSGMSR